MPATQCETLIGMRMGVGTRGRFFRARTWLLRYPAPVVHGHGLVAMQWWGGILKQDLGWMGFLRLGKKFLKIPKIVK